MKNTLLIFSLILSITYSCRASDELTLGDYQYMLKSMSERFCKNKKYLHCLSLSENKCVNSIEAALSECPTKTVDTLGSKVIDGVCVSLTYYKYTEVKENLINSCEKQYLKLEDSN